MFSQKADASVSSLIVSTINSVSVTAVLFMAATAASAATFNAISVEKAIDYVQTSATEVNVNPRPQAPDYGGAYSFGATVNGAGIGGITPPVVTGPIYVGEPWFNHGKLIYSGDAWKMGYPYANNWGSPTLSDLNSKFGSGTYTFNINGTTISLQLKGDAYPNAPILTLSGGTWANGKYVIESGHDLTITTSAFTAYGANKDGYMGLWLEEDKGSSIFDTDKLYSKSPGSNTLTYTVLASSLQPGRIYRIGASFGAIVDSQSNSAFPNSLIAASYSASTEVEVIVSSSASQSDCIFNWAEKSFPQYFSPSGIASQTLNEYYYRHYPSTGNYLATSSSDGHIWLVGTNFGFLDVGPVTSFLATAGCR